MYTQNQEEKHILEYFGPFVGRLLSIGENDGKTFSNSLRLIELGWDAVLIEPCDNAFNKMKDLHDKKNYINPSGIVSHVVCIKCAIGSFDGDVILHESGSHFKDKSDHGLLSSIKNSETEKWRSTVEFNEVTVPQVCYKTLVKMLENGDVKHDFDFITIDAEGMDLEILEQIDLTNVRMVCVEWNLNEADRKQIVEYCHGFGLLKEIYVTGENIILAR